MQDVSRRASKLIAAIAVAFAMVGATEACRTATQVELVVTYDGKCSDLNEVAFIIGTDPQVAEGRIESNVFTTSTTHCEQGSPSQVGSLVVTPNDNTGRASIIVLGAFGQHASDCKPEKGYAGCIVARRAFSFVDHTALTLLIPLEASCKDVPCDAHSTCTNMRCVNSNVMCAEGGCGDPGMTADGGVELADAPMNPDAFIQGLDAQPPMDGTIDDGAVDAPAGSCNGSDHFVSCTRPGSTTKTCTGTAPVCCYGSGFSAFGPMSFGPLGPDAAMPDAAMPDASMPDASMPDSSMPDGSMPDGSMPDAATTAMGYDCRPADMCATQLGEPNVNCRSAADCHAGAVCCFDHSGGGGTFCVAGSACPMEGAMTSRVCGAACECPGGQTCVGPRSVGTAPAQSFLVCQ